MAWKLDALVRLCAPSLERVLSASCRVPHHCGHSLSWGKGGFQSRRYEAGFIGESSGPYVVREVTVLDELKVPPGNRFGRTTLNEFSIYFSPDGRKITLTTIAPDSKGRSVRIETWDGTPRKK